MMEAAKPILEVIAEVVDLIGIAILLVGAVKFILLYARIEVLRLAGRQCISSIQRARQLLGGYILVSLEFLIVSDVVTTVVNRTLESLLILGAIIVLRTAIGYFLERELRSDELQSGDSA